MGEFQSEPVYIWTSTWVSPKVSEMLCLSPTTANAVLLAADVREALLQNDYLAGDL